MNLVFTHDPSPSRNIPVAMKTNTLFAAMAGCNERTDIDEWVQNQEEYLARGCIPVFLLLGSSKVLGVMQECNRRRLPFVLIDHPHDSAQRHKRMRITVGGIYPHFNPKAPVWRNYAWNIQPWQEPASRQILHCPSAPPPDFYGQYLGRHEGNTVGEAEQQLSQLQQKKQVAQSWFLVSRSRFESEWAAKNQDIRPGAKEAILASGAVADGNSVILLDALRLGVPAFVQSHPGKPLANTLASYAPLGLDALDDPSRWRIDREQLFAHLAMSDVSLDELADQKLFRRLVEWQLEYTFPLMW